MANKEWSIGAFVLPNEVIDERTPLVNFLVPGEWGLWFLAIHRSIQEGGRKRN